MDITRAAEQYTYSFQVDKVTGGWEWDGPSSPFAPDGHLTMSRKRPTEIDSIFLQFTKPIIFESF